MIAIDTNLLVRLAVRDDAVQLAKVNALLATETALILSSVLLETEWVLRARYQLQPAEIAAFFEHVASSEGLEFENPQAVLTAIAAYAKGVGFADALHAATAMQRDLVFYTFDAPLKRRAGRIKGARIQTP